MKRKKKTVQRSAASRKSHPVMVFIRRHTVVLFPVLLIVGFLVTVPKNALNQSVLGSAITTFRAVDVDWTSVPHAAGYNIYYKPESAVSYTYAARNLPASPTRYTIHYLKENVSYEYKIAAYDAAGKEFWFSEPQAIPGDK